MRHGANQMTETVHTTAPATTFDFLDGRGPVPAHQHPNGGGWVDDKAKVDPTAFVDARARVFGTAQVFGDARVFGTARVFGDAQVFGNAQVFGTAQVFGNAQVSGNARVECSRHVAQIGPIGRSAATLTLFRETGGGHRYSTGCFSGSFTNLEAASRTTHGPGSPHYAAYGSAAVALWKIVFPGEPIPAVPHA